MSQLPTYQATNCRPVELSDFINTMFEEFMSLE